LELKPALEADQAIAGEVLEMEPEDLEIGAGE